MAAIAALEEMYGRNAAVMFMSWAPRHVSHAQRSNWFHWELILISLVTADARGHEIRVPSVSFSTSGRFREIVLAHFSADRSAERERRLAAARERPLSPLEDALLAYDPDTLVPEAPPPADDIDIVATQISSDPAGIAVRGRVRTSAR